MSQFNDPRRSNDAIKAAEAAGVLQSPSRDNDYTQPSRLNTCRFASRDGFRIFSTSVRLHRIFDTKRPRVISEVKYADDSLLFDYCKSSEQLTVSRADQPGQKSINKSEKSI